MSLKDQIPLAKEEPYTFQELADIIAVLRSPEGCPWDREQTFVSMEKYLRNESEEVFEAVKAQDASNLCEELGDVLLQVLLYSQIAADEGLFTLSDVIDGISRKMIRRHPHVFSDVVLSSREEGIAMWEEIKRREKEKN